MTRQLIIRTEAEVDIAEATLWYQDKTLGLGDEFLAAVRDAVQHAVKNPLLHRRLRRRPEVRRVLMERFPYRVFFILRADAVVVLCVLHGARHDREWKRSL